MRVMPQNALRYLTGALLLGVGALLISIHPASARQSTDAPSAPAAARPASGSLRVPARRTRSTVALPSKSSGIAPESLRVSQRLPVLNLSRHRKSAHNEIGLARALPVSSSVEMGDVVFTSEEFDGRRVRIFSLQSPGAVELRVRFADFDLPEGDEVYVYGVEAESLVAGPYRSRGPHESLRPTASIRTDGADEGFWSETIAGDTVIIEHVFRGEERPFRVAEVMHHYEPFISATGNAASATSVLPCHNDARCTNDPLNGAVGRITFIANNASFVCSGTMLNTQAQDYAPYFLTANHCVSSVSVASTVQAAWLYQSTGCNSGIAGSLALSTTGAVLLNTEASSDQTLLRILFEVPRTLYYSGWTTAAQGPGSAIYGLHHPRGTFLRRSLGIVTATNEGCLGLSNGYLIGWYSGNTEPGSSGSGLFLGNGQLVGALSCGDTNEGEPYCESASIYGKLSSFYPDISDFLVNGDYGVNPVATAIGNTHQSSLTTGSSWSRSAGVGWRMRGYAFNGQAGDRVQITLTSSAFDAYLALFGPYRNLIASNNNGAGGTNARITVTLPETGEYLIEVSTAGPGATGAYQLSSALVQLFADVPTANFFYRHINLLAAYGITTGCNPPTNNLYCPGNAVTREQMAAFLLRAVGEFNPPQPVQQMFVDVPPANFFYRFVDRLAVRGITTGCNPPTNNLYCPGSTVTREQMAAFLLRALGEFNPPMPASQRFADVPPANFFYRFIDRLAVLGVTTGCGSGNYCPGGVVTREQMAAFLARAFTLGVLDQ